MPFLSLLMTLVLVALVLEEFVLIKPVSTIAKSDALSRRLELAALWFPAFGIGFTSATLPLFGGVRLGGAVNALGFLLCVGGVALRYWSRRTLGRFFTIGVVKQDRHEVVRSGPYRWVRHPAYLGFVLFYVGLPLLIGSYVGLAALSLPATLIFVFLCRVEDTRLTEELGEPYAAFRKERAALLPGIW